MRIPSDAVKFGRNQDDSNYDDDHYVRCRRCGFIDNTQRDFKSYDGSKVGFGTVFYRVYQETTIVNGRVTNIENGSTV